MDAAYLLEVSEKIFNDIRDEDTLNTRFVSLWDHPCVLETFLLMLREDDEDHRESFEIICDLLCPEFLASLS